MIWMQVLKPFKTKFIRIFNRHNSFFRWYFVNQCTHQGGFSGSSSPSDDHIATRTNHGSKHLGNSMRHHSARLQVFKRRNFKLVFTNDKAWSRRNIHRCKQTRPIRKLQIQFWRSCIKSTLATSHPNRGPSDQIYEFVIMINN